MTEKYEQNLLMELEGLTNLQKLFQGFDNILEEMIDEYGDTLDSNLVICLECVRYDINLTLSGVVKFEDFKVQGILKQLDDVQDEVQTLQAGLPTKQGVKDEE
jgi:hypothetical protein